MKFKIIYNPKVYHDLQETIDWYNGKSMELGKRFYNSVKEEINILKKYPLNFAVRYDDVRCMTIKKFPYIVHYRTDIENDTIYVEAVFSTDRNPQIWKDRTEKY